MVILSQLFGSELRVRMMRLFLFNPDKAFDMAYIQGKAAAKPRELEGELAFLKKLGLLKEAKVSKPVVVRKGKKELRKKVRESVYSLDQKFKYRDALSEFLVKTHSLENRAVVKKLEKAGKIKAVLLAGIFTGQPESRLDLFVVGDNVNASSMDRIVRSIESDMGKDIRYAVLSAPDFAYRLSMNDKLVRDVIDYPHRVLVDKIGIAK